MAGGRQAPCPNCGGPIQFGLGSSAAQICPYCRHSVVRTDRDLRSLGKVADLVPTAPLMTVGDRGVVAGEEFVVGGRLQLDHGQGPWDEWYVEFSAQRRWAWLAKAQGRWYLTYPVAASGLPTFDQVVVGGRGTLPGAQGTWVVAEKSGSTLVSAEGELPEPVTPGESGRYVDLEGEASGFATVDYGDGTAPPTLYVGKQLAHDDVRFTKSALGPRPEERVALGKLSCPSCGAPIELTSPESAQRAACSSCHSLLDHTAGNLAVVGKLAELARKVYLPLGTRGTLRGLDVRAIGTMERYVVDEGITYTWTEYLLHSAQGYRWLVEDSGHFTFVAPVSNAEVQDQHFRAVYSGRNYKAYNRGTATVRSVLGEFYWKVAAGETVATADYIAPPYILSSEQSAKEISWSAGEYVSGAEVWKAFGLAGSPPSPQGVGAAQPNTIELKPAALFFAITAVLMLAIFAITAPRGAPPETTLVSGPVSMPPAPDEAIAATGREVRVIGVPSAGVTPTAPHPPTRCPSAPAGAVSTPTITPAFAVPDGVTAVDVRYEVSGPGSWVGLNSALIDMTRGQGQQWTDNVGDFHSMAMTTGSASATLAGLQPGPHTLRVAPHWAREACPPGFPPALSVTVITHHEHRSMGGSVCCCGSATLLLTLPLLIAFVRRRSFEGRRWQNSSLA